MDLAEARAEEVGVAGLAVDWSKCYDRLRLSVLRRIAVEAGIPDAIAGPMLAAYGQARRILCEGLTGQLRKPECGLAPAARLPLTGWPFSCTLGGSRPESLMKG